MDAPSDRSKQDLNAEVSQVSEPSNARVSNDDLTDSESAKVAPKSLDALPRPRSRRGGPPPDVKDLDLPGIKKRPSLAPPAPPPSHAPPAPTTHDLFDVESAALDYESHRVAERAARRASARPHPPRRTQASISDADVDDGARTSAAPAASVQKLSTPLSWTAAKDPTLEEVPEDLLEPLVDSAPLALPPSSSEPLASAIPMGSVVTPLPSAPTKKHSALLTLAALGVAGLLTTGWLILNRPDGDARASSAEGQAEPAAATERSTSEANPALRVPLPPLELDIGVPVNQPVASASPLGSAQADPSSVPPVAPKGVLPELPATPEEPPTPALPPFDSAAATAALSQAAASVASCRKEGDPVGSATVIVRYAPSGRVTSSTVEAGPFAGTVTGGCIATTFRKARVPAFTGDYVTVKKTVSIR
jgi:hypothetical protein